MTSGWILLDKPSGMTSRRAGGIVARALGAKTFGHIGTLDPFATGLLPIALGEATKMIPYIENVGADIIRPKEYLFSVQWGFETDTLDITGKIVKKAGKIPRDVDIVRACAELSGKITQIPPQYSAISVNGVRAYKSARAGKTVEIPPREIMIYKLESLDFGVGSRDNGAGNNLNSKLSTRVSSHFRVVCSPGTYVRVLAQQICERINQQFLCTVDTLRRVRTSGFEIKNAVTLDFPENLVNNLLPVDYGLGDIPVCNLNKTDADTFLHGGFIELTERKAQSNLVRVYCENKFIGIGNTESGILKPKRVIID